MARASSVLEFNRLRRTMGRSHYGYPEEEPFRAGPPYRPPTPYEEEMAKSDAKIRQWGIQCEGADAERRLFERYWAHDFHRIIGLGRTEDFPKDPDPRKPIAPMNIELPEADN